MRRVIWHRRAEEDLSQAYLYIGADSPTSAERLLDAVEATVESLRECPDTGRIRQFESPRAQSVRSRVVRGFLSYLIFYRLDGDALAVIRILHGARDVDSLFEDES